MNPIIASFTRGEKWLIAMILFILGGGLGIQQFWSGEQKTMSFSASSLDSAVDSASAAATLPAGMSFDGRININEADGKTLESLPGIGPSLAGAILRYREGQGAFGSMTDLDRVPGIGPAMMTKLAPLIEFGPGGEGVKPVQEPVVNGLTSHQTPEKETRGGVPVPNRVNINTAGIDELDSLNGIGPALARRIVEDRQRSGPFRTVKDLDRVKGIGPSILSKNQELLTVQ